MVLHICTNPCVYKLCYVFVYKHSIVCIRTVSLRVYTHLSMSTCVYLRRISCLYTRIFVFVYALFCTYTRCASTKKSCVSTISGPYWWPPHRHAEWRTDEHNHVTNTHTWSRCVYVYPLTPYTYPTRQIPDLHLPLSLPPAFVSILCLWLPRTDLHARGERRLLQTDFPIVCRRCVLRSNIVQRLQCLLQIREVVVVFQYGCF